MTDEQESFGQAMAALTNEFGPVYQHGHLSIENSVDIAMMDLQDCDVGVQVAADGRIWLCVNGTAFIRFKPTRWVEMGGNEHG